ncbi:MAG TPA: hypothetical protein VGD22_08280 [Sphingobacteriaceae bacterium]
MTPWTDSDIQLYSSIFDIADSFVGKQVNEITFYLDYNAKNFTEQPNEYGKSLLNGLDLKINDQFYSIGNRFTEAGYGLAISKGWTSEFEYIEIGKRPTNYPSILIGQMIKSVDIYWMKVPFEGAIGYYPQEIEFTTENGFLLISSIEVNHSEVNTEFTNEILLVDNKDAGQQLKLGRYGVTDNGRECFKTFEELQQADKRNWC